MNPAIEDKPSEVINIACTHGKQPATLDLLWIELTATCNLKCSHCYAESGPRIRSRFQLNETEYRQVISQAKSLSCQRLQFIGGEPTLSPALKPLVELSSDLSFKSIEVFTNCTKLTDDLVAFFYTHSVTVAFSFYSPKAEVHDAVTMSKGSHSAMLSGLRRLVNAGVRTSAAFIETPFNKGELAASKDFLFDLGIRYVHSDVYRRIGRGRALTGPGTSIPEDDSQTIETNGEGFILDELCGLCGNGRLAILPDGSVTPCVMARKCVLGSIRQLSLHDFLASTKLSGFRREIEMRRMKSLTIAHDDQPDRSPQCSPNHNPQEKPDSSPQCSPNHNPQEKPDSSPQCSPNHNPLEKPAASPERRPLLNSRERLKDNTVPSNDTLVELFSQSKYSAIPMRFEPIGDTSEIYRFRVLSPEQCQAIVASSSSMIFDSSRTSVRSEEGYRTSNDAFFAGAVEEAFNTFALPFLAEITRGIWDWQCNMINDSSIIRYEVGERFKEHVDASESRLLSRRHVTFLIHLNDDFEGGETLFRRQSIAVRPQTGYGIVFPSGITHPHESLIVRSGVKYVLVGWLTRH